MTKDKTEYVGETYGKLKISKEYSIKTSSGKIRRMFSCLCLCGNSIEVRKDCVVNGKTKSCGCYRSEIEFIKCRLGDTFNYLTAVTNSTLVAGNRIADFKCICGTVKSLNVYNVLSGATKSCGCYNKQRLKDEPIGIKIPKDLWSDISKLYEGGHTTYDIADKFSVCSDTISRLLKLNGTAILPKEDKCLFKDNHINRTRFSDISCPSTAYYYGLLLSDGNITKNTISIELKDEDSYLLENFHSWLNATTKIHRRSRKDSRTNKTYSSISVSVTDKVVADNLRKLGMKERKSLNEVLPDQFAYNRDFWRGMIDGDGHVSKVNNRVSLCGSEDICAGFRNYVKSINNSDYQPTFSKVGKLHVVSFCRFDVCKAILDSLYIGSSLFLKRKHDNYLARYYK